MGCLVVPRAYVRLDYVAAVGEKTLHLWIVVPELDP
jgi:hypothetical protein